MTLAFLFTAEHVSDVNTSIRVQAEPVVRPALGYHITNRQSCYTNTPQVSLHNNATSSRKLLKMDVLTSETR